MAGLHGVKETKEALLALAVLGAFVAKRLKDGVQLEDATALAAKLMGDAEFKAKVAAGIEGIEAVPKELAELDLEDIIALLAVVPEMLTQIKAELEAA